MNYVTNEVQDNQQRGLLSAMFGDSRKMGLDIAVTPNNQTTNANIFINNTPGNQALYNGSDYVRVVVQDGSKAPWIIVMKMR